MSFVFAPMLLFLTAFGGAGNQTLDFVDSATYWKIAGIEMAPASLVPLIADEERPAPDHAALEALVADLKSPDFITRQKAVAALAKAGPDARPVLEKARTSDDPEVATTATQILSKLGRDTSDSRIHRLMAIRTLGELKAPEAAPHLEKLTSSPEPFIADYASSALAAIRGEIYSPAKPDPLAFQKDLEIAFPSLAAVLHTKSAPRHAGVTIRSMIDQTMPLVGGFAGGGGPGIPDTEEILREMTGQIVEVLHSIGNVRLDSASVFIPSDVTPEGGGFIIALRGLYDHKRSLAYVRDLSGGTLDSVHYGKTEWLSGGGEFFIHFASDELLVMIAGSDVAKYAEAVSDRIEGNDKQPAAGPAVDLLKNIPKAASAFFTAEIPDAMAESEPTLAAFKTIVGSLTPGEAGVSALDVQIRGSDEKPVAEIFTQMQMGLAMGKGAVAGMAKAEKKLAPLAEMMDSIEIKQAGTTISGKASIPSSGNMPLGMIFGSFMFGVRSMEPIGPGEPFVEEGLELAPPAEELAPEPPPEVRPE